MKEEKLGLGQVGKVLLELEQAMLSSTLWYCTVYCLVAHYLPLPITSVNSDIFKTHLSCRYHFLMFRASVFFCAFSKFYF